MRSRKFRRAALIEAIEPRRLLSTIYVDANATGATHDGASWNSAYQDLQQGLAAAVSGDEIRVADGTYKPTSGTDRTISFALKSGVSLFGGYAGDGAPNPDARDVASYATILSGDIGVQGNKADNSYHVVVATGIGSATAIDRLTVTLGNADGSGADRFRGGGLVVTSISALMITNCSFVANRASTGGGISCFAAAPTVVSCTFFGNTATSTGGGMHNDFFSSPKLTNCTFRGNTALSGGGMLISFQSSPSLLNCNFSGNTANLGAGMSNYNNAAPILAKCTFNGNIASGGGGMYNQNSSPNLTDCFFSGNVASAGAGIENEDHSSPILTNCTFNRNVGTAAGSSGDAIYNIDSSSPRLTNCIIWGGRAIHNVFVTSVPIVTYCDVEGSYSGTGNIDADPLFVRNPSPGTDGLWGTADDDYGDLRLQPGSPCIDAGNNAAVPTGVTTDLAGNPRIVDAPGARDFGERVDMGAYEYLPALTYQSDAAKPTLRMSFAFDVNPTTLSASDLVLLNLTSGQPLSTSGAAVSYDSNTRIATWQFSGALPDGDYRATLPAGSVSDTSGTPLASDSLCNFFTLGGDANRDRLVDIKDLYILSSNWQGDNKLFSQGDFNYDGKVDANDLAILSARWQQNLAPPVAAAPVSIAKLAKRSPVRMVSVVG